VAGGKIISDGTNNYWSFGQTTGNTQYYFGTDHLGSLRDVTDLNGNLVTEYDYDLWGNRTRIQGTQDFNFGFTGHWVIKDLVLAPFRTYNPYSGRWISRDPLGEQGGSNLYDYVLNDPIDLIDLFGMDAVPAPGGGYNFVVRLDLNLNNLAGSSITNMNPNYSGQCATGAQFLTGTVVNGQVHDAPSTSTWRPGNPVGRNTPKGTMIATGWSGNTYPSRPSGSYGPGQTVNHTGIFEGMNPNGTMNIYDQYTGKPLGAEPANPAGWNAVLSIQKYDPRVSNSAARPAL
jgi:RHS repeat-associated protein